MTTVIDHAIAIPTRPDNVWEILRDISKNPTWHPDSQRVQFLTTMKTGRGLRWRNTTQSNKEQVFEITAWYEGLGYEYRIVDGSIYPGNRGRIRLQEAPEGTIVQWTFSYDVQGFLSGIRNNLSMRGHADKLIVQGLRNIYAAVKETKVDESLDPETSKAYLKEAPNVEERASYQPRYPSKVASQEIPTVQVEDGARFKPPTHPERPLQAMASAPQIVEPPLSDEDTKPNPAIQQTGKSQDMVSEPDFLKAMPDKAQPLPMIEDEVSSPPQVEEETVSAPEVPSIGETDTVAVEDLEPETKPLQKGDGQAEVIPTVPGQDMSKLDTATISVFELFGIEKPSETEKVSTLPEKPAPAEQKPAQIQAAPVIEPPEAFMDSTPIVPDVQPETSNRRRGLRAKMRSQFTNLRVPKSDDKD